jgi:hypothetical protein
VRGVVLPGLLETLLLLLAGLVLAGQACVVGFRLGNTESQQATHGKPRQETQRAAPGGGLREGTREGIEAVGVHEQDPW